MGWTIIHSGGNSQWQVKLSTLTQSDRPFQKLQRGFYGRDASKADISYWWKQRREYLRSF